MEAFISEVQLFAFSFAPKGWAMCNGQTMQISQNQALFSLLGTQYGGDGITNFKLPNLQGRNSMHLGSSFSQGQASGEENHTLLLTEMPSHTHQVYASSNSPNVGTPLNNFFASNTGFSVYGSPTNQQMATNAISTVGNSQPHNNMSPYLTVNFCMCLVGLFPSRN